MMNTLYLRPGTPDDLNRDYLPQRIKVSDIVVNENGNNSQPYPERLKEFHAELVPGQGEDSWYEYVPESYDPSKPTPLVFSMHGGVMSGWGQCIYTSWSYVADRDGIIVVYPDAHNKLFWEQMPSLESEFNKHVAGFDVPDPTERIEDHRDCNFVLALLEILKKKYNIDEGRIFMQGMSAGNMMTTLFARYYGNLLAGAAGSAGPGSLSLLYDEDGKIINRGGPLGIWQTRPENNGFGMRDFEREGDIDRYNRIYWMKINEIDPTPEISIIGEDNFAFYQGKKAPMVFMDVKNRDHGQKLDEAFLHWDYFLSGLRRLPDGTIVDEGSVTPRKGDAVSFAFAEGIDKAFISQKVTPLSQVPMKWQKLKYHGLDGGQLVRGEYLMVSVRDLAAAVGAEYIPSEDTLHADVILRDGRKLQFARGSIGCLIDSTMRQMYVEAIHRNGELLISAEWFMRYLFGYCVTECHDMIYVTDHHAELSYFLADLIIDLLRGNPMPEDFARARKINWLGGENFG